MSSHSRWSASSLCAILSLTLLTGAAPAPRVLRVCADPNNLPFSNRAGQGFENRLAEIIARDIGARVQYTWWPERRGFVRRTLLAGECDVVLGLPAGYPAAALTRPYYRSSYVFVTRRDRHLHIHSFDDPRLRDLTIGLHAVGTDYAGTPPAIELARRGLVHHLVGYSIYGDYSRRDPPADLLRAVAGGKVDVAIAWGPLAGYYARHATPVPLVLDPVTPVPGNAGAMSFAIAAGARPADTATRAMLQRELDRRAGEIRRLLTDYGVPSVAPARRAVTQ